MVWRCAHWDLHRIVAETLCSIATADTDPASHPARRLRAADAHGCFALWKQPSLKHTQGLLQQQRSHSQQALSAEHLQSPALSIDWWAWERGQSTARRSNEAQQPVRTQMCVVACRVWASVDGKQSQGRSCVLRPGAGATSQFLVCHSSWFHTLASNKMAG